MKPTYRKPDAHRTIIEKTSTGLPVLGYLFVCLNAVFFGYLAINAPSTYFDLTKEDSWVENLSAIWLFLASLLLIATAFRERRGLPLCIYILGGIAFFFAAGEEISWGQRIFGFDTPDYLLDLNRQNEFNIHNIVALRQFRMAEYYGTLIFCIMIFAAFFYKKNTILGVPLPSIPLIFAFLVVLSYMPVRARIVPFISSPEIVLLLLFIIYMIFDRRFLLVVFATATMISVLTFSYVYSRHRLIFNTVLPDEIREYLFGFCCFLYSLELLFFRVRQTENSRYGDSGAGYGLERFDFGGRFRVPFWLAVSFIIVIGSIWLAPLKYFDTKEKMQVAKDTITEGTREFIKRTDPVIRSNFDVYMRENELLYVKDECNKEDINRFKFFLHIVPIFQSDLPHHRQQFGFDNLDFFGVHGDVFHDDKFCVVIRYLPKYDIARIRTGQYIKRKRIWEGEFTLK